MLGAFDVQAIVAIIGALVAAAIAILNAIQKKKASNTVRTLWAALESAAVFARSNGDPADQSSPEDAKMLDILSTGADSKEALGDFVHEVISEYQKQIGPGLQKIKGLAGNGDWEKILKKVIKP